jgi:hypothetical protein
MTVPRLVDPQYLIVPKPKKVVKPKTLEQLNPVNSNFMWYFFVLLLLFSLGYGLYYYIETTAITNPDLSCLPSNIQQNDFCRSILKEAEKNKPGHNFNKPFASNEDNLKINLKSF